MLNGITLQYPAERIISMPPKNENDKLKKNKQVIYLSIGICLGAGLGSIFNNIVLGICIGIALGIALGSYDKKR
ncbi:hypothetical protein OYT88_19975 [Sporolactobacillus sp. CQH2019]|uniref:hypothetical protein n=1 Tax=Sporolactobacillus sp. CQH2019 TaxID=3023512 RepID=UPI00236771FC|nr:hypothetical protein [Sporolactobacillus sp. CQH2019]MDD9150801.1 hypothetical protein [Sporolactobacillus sp. CQH2019]